MAIRDQRHAKASKQTTLVGCVDVGPPKWRVCGRGLNRSVHEGMNISNVKVHLRTHSRNENTHVCKHGQTRFWGYSNPQFDALIIEHFCD